jgi:hypothetical protein
MNTQKYSIWIEAEQWAAGEWTPNDDNTDVIVTFENGARWAATVFSYQNIFSLANKNRVTGECLDGRYFAATDMILVDEVTRRRIEDVVADMIDRNDFETYFASCEPIAEIAV